MAHPKTPLKAVKDLLVKELLFSLKHRLEIVSDGFALEENPFLKPPVELVIQLPQRVNFTLSNCVLSGYTIGDIDNLQAVVSTLASVKTLVVTTREKVKAAEVQVNDNLMLLPQQNSNTSFLISISSFFLILFISFLMKNLL